MQSCWIIMWGITGRIFDVESASFLHSILNVFFTVFTCPSEIFSIISPRSIESIWLPERNSYFIPNHPPRALELYYFKSSCCVLSAQPFSSIKHNKSAHSYDLLDVDFPLPFSFFNLCQLIFRVLSTFAFFFVGIIFFSSFSLSELLMLLRFFFSLPSSRGCFVQIFSNFEFSRDLGQGDGGRWVDWITYTHVRSIRNENSLNHLMPTRFIPFHTLD